MLTVGNTKERKNMCVPIAENESRPFIAYALLKIRYIQNTPKE